MAVHYGTMWAPSTKRQMQASTKYRNGSSPWIQLGSAFMISVYSHGCKEEPRRMQVLRAEIASVASIHFGCVKPIHIHLPFLDNLPNVHPNQCNQTALPYNFRRSSLSSSVEEIGSRHVHFFHIRCPFPTRKLRLLH